ncbi:MAG: class I SAM-dependent methyltransferase [Proteobacteria bacterium]|nr:class I SAM-dependent methyltransferase [Pseudomonadota bacterium]MBU1708761.1 class I SAM-dependent methyltransferase [Pseudomonadota bacterium]
MALSEWQYNELQQVGVNYSNFEEVARYDARMQKLRDIKSEILKLVAVTGPTAESTVLEIGIGTGEFAIAVSKLAKKVVAVDVSMAMLDYAKKKAAEKNIHNIEFHHSGFLTFNDSPEQFDIIYTQLALHHLPDFWKFIALKKINTLLKKGGKFFLKDVVYPSNIQNYDIFFAEIIKAVKDSGAAEFMEEYIVHIRDEFSTLDWIMEDILTKSGFAILRADVENSIIYNYLCEKA